MRKVTIEGKELELKGSTLTLLHFEQEFDEDMMGKIAELGQVANSLENLGQELQAGNFGALKDLKAMTLLRLAWALNKTAVRNVPNFEQWLEENEEISPFNAGFLQNVIEEVMSGCFRGTGANAKIPEAGEQPEGVKPQLSNDSNK
mgnify:CR=1 FL=1